MTRWRKRASSRIPALLAGIAGLGVAPAHANSPMYYLRTFGTRGNDIASLTWGLFILSMVVVVIIGVLVLTGVLRRRDPSAHAIGAAIPVTRGEGLLLPWIYGGLIVTVIILAGFVIWTVATMVAISKPAEKPAFTIAITGHQWWWELAYKTSDTSRSFKTANEIHIPVGKPVRIVLNSADVIHSFWVPQLSGKTDLIPGRTNETWIEADKPGVYRGQCTEYCGRQHAHMAIKLFADPPDKFRKWWNAQLQPAAAPASQDVKQGESNFLLQCGVCHTVRGTPAGGVLGPDLTHLMSRTTIASNTLPNRVGFLSGWIADPQHVKPGAKMPDLDLSGTELASIRTYLLTLK